MYDDTLTFVSSPQLLAGVNKNSPEQVFRLPWLEDTSSGLKDKFQEYCKGVNISYENLVPVMQTHDALPLIDSAVQGQGYC
jgi:LysR family glycine cleavage system transcriptional activator